jgi:hypothetical protein
MKTLIETHMRLQLVIHWLLRQVVFQKKKKAICRVTGEVLISMNYVSRTIQCVTRQSVSESEHNTKRPTGEFCLVAYLIITICINVHNLRSEGLVLAVCNVFGSPVIV